MKHAQRCKRNETAGKEKRENNKQVKKKERQQDQRSPAKGRASFRTSATVYKLGCEKMFVAAVAVLLVERNESANHADRTSYLRVNCSTNLARKGLPDVRLNVAYRTDAQDSVDCN